MKVKDILAVLGVAAATTAFAVGLLGPGRVGATSKPEGITPTIAQPELTIDGCVFTLKTDKVTYKAGETLVIHVRASNPSDKPAKREVWVRLSAFSPPSPLSRIALPAQPLGIEKYLVFDLQPRETKTVKLASETELPVGKAVLISMSDKKQEIVARELAVPLSAQATQAPNQPANAGQLGR